MTIPRDNITRRRLLRGHEVYINCWDDDGARFVTLFRQTWKQLPLSTRRAILRFWRDNADEWAPLIEVSNSWAPRYSFGQVGRAGLELKFRQQAFACFPPPAARWVIAHELAHIYQKTCGRPPGGENEGENEDHADNLAEEWGFSRLCLNCLEMMQ